MDKKIAYEIIDEYYSKKKHEKEDEEDLIEALKFLSDNDDTKASVSLGGIYYENKKFELAEKYYLKAADEGSVRAMTCLGYVYYYGRVGSPDYEKAFKYYKLASDMRDIEATYKLSDMYKNGYFVEKDSEKEYELLKKAEEMIETNDDMFNYGPDVLTRLSNHEFKRGNNSRGLDLLYKARKILTIRLQYNPTWWGDISIMSGIIENLYKYDPDMKYDKSIYDLIHLVKKEGTYKFSARGKIYEITSEADGELISILFDGKWYKSIQEFFINAKIDGYIITSIATEVRVL